MAGAALVLIGMFWFSRSTAEAKATVLLKRAASRESKSNRPGYMRVRLRSGGCIISAEAYSGDQCTRLRSQFAAAQLDPDNPLSARSFEHWRDSLASKRDTVLTLPDVVVIQTTTREGELRMASLQLRSADYVPTEAHFEFLGQEPIDVAEEDRLPEAPVASKERVSPVPPVSAAKPAAPRIDAAGEAEIQVFDKLHAIAADHGYETSVRRTQNGTAVLGVVRDEARRAEILNALGGLPFVAVNIETYEQRQPGEPTFLPVREQTGTEPALARDWLRAAYPNETERNEFTSALLAASQRILGETTALEEIIQAQARLFHFPDAARLASIAEDHRRRIEQDLAHVQAAIQPIAGSHQTVVVSPLTREQAATLDSALLRIFYLAPASDSLDAEIDRLPFLFQ